MIFGKIKPWQTLRQRQLLRACFHIDPAKALELASRWFDTFALDETTYAEHRLLVRLVQRFPEAAIKPSDIALISGLERQLWVRSNLNFKTAMPAFAALDAFDIPWVLIGSTQWFACSKMAQSETADIIEFTAPDSARSAALHVLAQNGWRLDWAASETVAEQAFSGLSKGQGAIRFTKASTLFANTSGACDRLWKNRVSQNHTLGAVYVPDADSCLNIALGKAYPKFNPDDQWVFDLFNIGSDPAHKVLSSNAPPRHIRRVVAALRTCFYR